MLEQFPGPASHPFPRPRPKWMTHKRCSFACKSVIPNEERRCADCWRVAPGKTERAIAFTSVPVSLLMTAVVGAGRGWGYVGVALCIGFVFSFAVSVAVWNGRRILRWARKVFAWPRRLIEKQRLEAEKAEQMRAISFGVSESGAGQLAIAPASGGELSERIAAAAESSGLTIEQAAKNWREVQEAVRGTLKPTRQPGPGRTVS